MNGTRSHQSSNSTLRRAVPIIAITSLFIQPPPIAREYETRNSIAEDCRADCNADSRVTVDEILTQVENILGLIESLCPPVPLEIQDIIAAVNAAGAGCPLPVRYRLTEGSTIVFVPTPGEVATPQAISGTFTLVQSQSLPPNTVFGFTITAVDLRGESGLTVTNGTPNAYGCSGELSLGCLESVTFEFPLVYASIVVSINGHDVQFEGGGTNDRQPPLPKFILELCGPDQACSFEAIRNGAASGYALRLLAVPTE